jgi:cholesterol oxidase
MTLAGFASSRQMRPHYDVVVVGSGYGGAIAASRMARAGGASACWSAARSGSRANTRRRWPKGCARSRPTSPSVGRPPTALFDFRVNPRSRRWWAAAWAARR